MSRYSVSRSQLLVLLIFVYGLLSFFFFRPPCQNRSSIQWHLSVRFNLLRIIRFAILTTPCHRWEFFTTLDFEWEVFTGKRPWKWSFIVYLAARLLALMATVGDLVGFNLTSQFDCDVSIRFGIPLFSTDQPNLAAGLVPFSPFCVVVLSGCCLVPSRTSWVNEP
jgi:hypothetical protein